MVCANTELREFQSRNVFKKSNLRKDTARRGARRYVNVITRRSLLGAALCNGSLRLSVRPSGSVRKLIGTSSLEEILPLLARVSDTYRFFGQKGQKSRSYGSDWTFKSATSLFTTFAQFAKVFLRSLASGRGSFVKTASVVPDGFEVAVDSE